MSSRKLFAVGICAALTAGCGWGVEAHGPVVYAEPAYVEVSTVPVDIEVAPVIVYEGRPTYFYQDRWYYREGPRWRYYRHEPSVLIQHRQRLRVQHAPAAHPQHHDGHGGHRR